MKKYLVVTLFLVFASAPFGIVQAREPFKFYASGVITPTSEEINYEGQILVDEIVVPWEKCEDKEFVETVTFDLPDDLVQIDIPEGCQWITPEQSAVRILKCHCKKGGNDVPCEIDITPFADYVTQQFRFTENVCMSGESVVSGQYVAYRGTLTDDDTGIVTTVKVGTPVKAYVFFRTPRNGTYTITKLVRLNGILLSSATSQKIAFVAGEEVESNYNLTPDTPGFYVFVFRVRGPAGYIARRIPLRVIE